MRAKIPLSAKLLGWLALNFAVLLALALAFIVSTFGLRWSWIEGSPLGTHLRSLAEGTMTELRFSAEDERALVLARREKATGFVQALFDSEGLPLAGTDIEVPEALATRLKVGPPPPFGEPPPPRPPPSPDGIPQRPPRYERFGHAEGPPGFHRSFACFAGSPTRCYIGYRLMLEDPSRGEFTPATLVIVLPSIFSLLTVFNFWILLAVGTGALAVSALVWWPFLRNLNRFIRATAEAANEYAEGRLAVRIQAKRSDELGVLADDINRMAERLEALVKAQRRFLSDAAHELGSPLARLQISAAILEERPESCTPAMVADIKEEIQLMAALTQELLVYSRLQGGLVRATLEPVGLLASWTRVAAREDKERHIHEQLPPDLKVLAKPDLMDRILSNLTRNVLRYAPGAPAAVSAYRKGTQTVLVFRDEGPGVPEEFIGRLGAPFVRPDAARARETGGHGLGLAIVCTAVEACNGRIQFLMTQPRGLTVELTFNSAD